MKWQNRKKEPNHTDDVAFEKVKEECTFHPNIEPLKISPYFSASRGADKVVKKPMGENPLN